MERSLPEYVQSAIYTYIQNLILYSQGSKKGGKKENTN